MDSSRGTGRPNLSRQTKFSGAHGDKRGEGKHSFPVKLTLAGEDWQPYPFDPYSAAVMPIISININSGDKSWRYILYILIGTNNIDKVILVQKL